VLAFAGIQQSFPTKTYDGFYFIFIFDRVRCAQVSRTMETGGPVVGKLVQPLNS